MNNRYPICYLLLALLCPLLFSGCPRHTQGLPFEDNIVAAVAPFTQATETRDLMAGFIPPESEILSESELAGLDAAFLSRILKPLADSGQVRACMASAETGLEDELHSSLDFWVAVGACAGADYLIVPQVLYWKERDGSSLGVTEPAGVVIDYSVIDVPEHGMATRVHFEETQVSLTENLLTVDKFIRRSGQWVTARELAEESLDLVVKELEL